MLEGLVSRKHRLTFLVALSLLAPVAIAGQPQVNGRIEQIGPFRLLRVWGTPQEMGYAHGFLLGPELAASIRGGLFVTARGESEKVERGRKALRKLIEIPESARQELEGLLSGMVAGNGGALPVVAGLDRPVHLDDFILTNSQDALRGFGCSGFTVWGARAGSEGVITGRTFDFNPGPGKSRTETQLILVRQPTGKHQVATVTWPGYIGAFTGINDAGVCAFMHDGTGRRQAVPKGEIKPVALALKGLLEDSGVEEAQTNAGRVLGNVVPYPFSYMVRIISPRVEGKVEIPATVFRVDAMGLSANPGGDTMCITTNHYLNLAMGPLTRASEGSLKRYDTLNERLKGTVTSEVAWSALRAVASTGQEFPTLHALVVFPERRRIDLGFATWEGRVVAATKGDPMTIPFDKLFAPHP